jgi:hypothetical protein
MFDKFNSTLSIQDAESIRELVKTRRTELLAALSEDARIRVVEHYIEEVSEILGQRSGR